MSALSTWALSISTYTGCFPCDVIDTTRVIAIVDEVPYDWCIEEVSCCGVAGCDCSIVWMRVVNVGNVVVVVVWVEVIHESIRVIVAWPCELVDSSIVVVVFIESSCTRPIVVFVSYSIVVVVEGVLVSEVECSYRSRCCNPWVESCFNDESISGYVSWIKSLCFESCVVDWSFEDTIVVVVPIIDIEDTIVVVVEGVSTIASVETFDKVVNTVVVVVKIVQIADSVVVVVVFVGFFNEEVV